jgi:hypothetical protein
MLKNLDPKAQHKQYFRQSSTSSNWHHISQEALTKSKAASVTVESADLSNWSMNWWLSHEEHADGSNNDNNENAGDENSSNGPCPCCGKLPPHKYDTLVVEASDKPYVTIYNYITAVHL